jgi:biotin carboxylase
MSAYTYPYATGVNLMKLMLDVALGKKDINVKQQWNFYSCELGLVSKKDGVLKRVENTYDALCVPYIKNIFILREENEKVVKTCNNVSKLGNVISQAPMAGLAVKYCKKALSMLKPIYK